MVAMLSSLSKALQQTVLNKEGKEAFGGKQICCSGMSQIIEKNHFREDLHNNIFIQPHPFLVYIE